MEIELDKITAFFVDYRNIPMPESLRELVLKRGDKISFGNLETGVTDFKTLKSYLDSEAIKKISRSTRKESFPLLRIGKTPVYFVYDPKTGDCFGGFSDYNEMEEERFLAKFSG